MEQNKRTIKHSFTILGWITVEHCEGATFYLKKPRYDCRCLWFQSVDNDFWYIPKRLFGISNENYKTGLYKAELTFESLEYTRQKGLWIARVCPKYVTISSYKIKMYTHVLSKSVHAIHWKNTKDVAVMYPYTAFKPPFDVGKMEKYKYSVKLEVETEYERFQ